MPKIMKYLLIISLLIGNILFGNAQEEENELYVGLDIGKNIPVWLTDNYYFDGGGIFEPTLKWKFSDIMMLNTSIMYANLKKSERSKINIQDFRSKGVGIKLGIEFLKKNRILERTNGKTLNTFTYSTGLNLTYSNFQETGYFVIEEPVFGDYRQQFERKKLQNLGLELTTNFWIGFSPKILLLIELRGNLAFYPVVEENEYQALSVYYLPGVGRELFRNRDLNNDGNANEGLFLSAGITFKLLYRIL